MAFPGINWSHPLARGLVYDAVMLGTGAAIPDRTGNSPDLTLAGGAGWGTTAYGNALVLTGALADAANTASGVGLPVGALDDFTLEVAADIASVATLAHVFGFGPAPATNTPNGSRRASLMFDPNTGTGTGLYFWGIGADLYSGTAWGTGLKYATFTRKRVASPASDTITFYVNGSSVASATTPAALDTAESQIWIGGGHISASNTFVGKVPIARIRNVALTSSEVTGLYAAPFAFLASAYARRSSANRTGSRAPF
jgi:hypothetical protein